MQKYTVVFSKDSSNLFFHILTKCNLSCRHCYINPEQHGRQTLDIETIKSWLDIFSEKARQTHLILLGGEPTLHPDLSLAVHYGRQLGFKSITIDTNGYLFHDILEKISCNDVDFLSFSLDGATPETNDAIRGEGSFKQVLKGVESARAKNFSCSMIYTVSSHNIHEIDQMPALAKDLGISHFFIQVIGLRGNSGNADESLQVSKKVWLEKIPKVAEAVAAEGITVTYPKVFLSTSEIFECAGNVADNYFIFPNGRVYQCPLCEDFSMHAFEICDGQLLARPKINEKDFFSLDIPEGCVMNKLVQPENLDYDTEKNPLHQIACCMLKEEIIP